MTKFEGLSPSCILLCASIWSAPAQAGLLDDAWGILTDPFKLDSSSEKVVHSIERAAIHANQLLDRTEGLQEEADRDIRDYLDKVDGIASDTRKSISDGIDQIGQISDQAFDRLKEAETKFIFDIRDTIKCGSGIVGEQLRTSLATTLSDFGRRKPRLEIFGVTILSVRLDKTDITSPIDSFREVKVAYDSMLNQIAETDPAHKFIDIYGNMQRLSRLARCHYKDESSVYLQLYEYELEYTRLDKYWNGAVQAN